MDFHQVVDQRRAVRQYRQGAIDRRVLEELIRTAVLAPSAMNLQPWAFAVVSGSFRIDEYARRAKAHLTAMGGAPAALHRRLEDPAFSLFYHAPALVVVLATADEPQAREDACLAAQTLLLAARNEGFGSCWIGLARPWLELPQTRAELGIPEHCHVVAPIVIGHAAEWPESPGRREPEIFWA